jgi:hypothetical protein
VSAILEALKKLEQETSEPTGNPLRPEVRHERGWRWTSLAGGLVIGVVVFGLAGYGLVALTGKAPAIPETAIGKKMASSSRAAPVLHSSKPAPKPVPAVRATNPASAIPIHQTVAPAKQEASRKGEEVQPPDEKIVAVALEPEEPTTDTDHDAIFAYGSKRWHGTAEELPEETSGDAVMAPSEADMSLAGGTDAERALNAAPDINHDPEAVLQAISWSQDAGRRMAVINGKICREGEPIGGYVILKINPEDVVVSKGGVTGRLVFKIH